MKWYYEINLQADGTIVTLIEWNHCGKIDVYPMPQGNPDNPVNYQAGYGDPTTSDMAYNILLHYFLSFKFTMDEAKELATQYQNEFRLALASRGRYHVRISSKEVGDWWITKANREIDQQTSKNSGRG